MRAICARCGEPKVAYDQVCSGCGHRPSGEGLLVAWLLSTEHLPDSALPALAERVRRGEAIRPSERMLAAARRALRRDLTGDAGLGLARALALCGVSVLVTPLPALVLAVWWWRDRPRSSAQATAAGALGVCAMGVLTALWLVRAGGLGGAAA